MQDTASQFDKEREGRETEKQQLTSFLFSQVNALIDFGTWGRK
jgi:hypothetical protein